MNDPEQSTSIDAFWDAYGRSDVDNYAREQATEPQWRKDFVVVEEGCHGETSCTKDKRFVEFDPEMDDLYKRAKNSLEVHPGPLDKDECRFRRKNPHCSKVSLRVWLYLTPRPVEGDEELRALEEAASTKARRKAKAKRLKKDRENLVKRLKRRRKK